MRKYWVTYDILEGGHYHPIHRSVFADNAVSAKSFIIDDYWNKVNTYAEKRRVSLATARRNFRYPFHIEAKRVKED